MMKSEKTKKIEAVYVLLPALLIILALAIGSIVTWRDYYRELEGVRGH